MIRRLAIITAALVATVALAGCGQESDETRAVDAVAAGLVADPSLAPYGVTEADGECLGEFLVDELGAEVVLDLGTDEDGVFASVSPDQVQVLGDGLDECVSNIDEITNDLLTQNLPTAAEAVDGAPTLNPDQAQCIADDVVGNISLARLIAIGSGASDDTPTPLTVAEATTFAAAYVSCTDARATILADVAAQGATPEEVACFDSNISEADLVERFSAAFLGEEEPDTFGPAAAACF